MLRFNRAMLRTTCAVSFLLCLVQAGATWARETTRVRDRDRETAGRPSLSASADRPGSRQGLPARDEDGGLMQFYGEFQGAGRLAGAVGVSLETAPSQSSPSSVLPISFDVVFERAIDPASFDAGDIIQDGSAQAVSWEVIDSGDAQHFTLRATQVVVGGTVAPVVSPGSVATPDGETNFQSVSLDNEVNYAGPLAGPSIVTFQNGVTPNAAYDGATDTELKELEPTTNSGMNELLRLNGDSVGLIRFDTSLIPPGFIVNSATLTVFATTDLSNTPYPIYEALQSWTENQATWNVRKTGVPWDAPGASGIADRGAVVVGTLLAPAAGPYDIVLDPALVQGWIDDPSTNHGLILANAASTDPLTFITSDEADVPIFRPKLTVDVSPAGPPAGAPVLYVGTRNPGQILVYDLTDPVNPVLLQTRFVGDDDYDLETSDGVLYYASVDIAAYAIQADGQLGNPAIVHEGGGAFDEITADPGGNCLYGSHSSGDIVAYDISSTGTPIETDREQGTSGGETGAVDPHGVAVHPNGSTLYVSNGASFLYPPPSETIGIWDIDAGCELSNRRLTDYWPLANYFAIDPLGRFLHYTERPGPWIFTDSIEGGGDLSQGSMAVAGTGPTKIIVNSDGTRVYVANQMDANKDVTVFAVNTTTGAKTQRANVESDPMADHAEDLILHPDETYLYVVASGDPTGKPALSIYAVNPGGALELDLVNNLQLPGEFPFRVEIGFTP